MACQQQVACLPQMPADWTLPEGFDIELYVAGTEPVPKARSLAISGASQPNGPVITYVSSISFDATVLMNVGN